MFLPYFSRRALLRQRADRVAGLVPAAQHVLHVMALAVPAVDFPLRLFVLFTPVFLRTVHLKIALDL